MEGEVPDRRHDESERHTARLRSGRGEETPRWANRYRGADLMHGLDAHVQIGRWIQGALISCHGHDAGGKSGWARAVLSQTACVVVVRYGMLLADW